MSIGYLKHIGINVVASAVVIGFLMKRARAETDAKKRESTIAAQLGLIG